MLSGLVRGHRSLALAVILGLDRLLPLHRAGREFRHAPLISLLGRPDFVLELGVLPRSASVCCCSMRCSSAAHAMDSLTI